MDISGTARLTRNEVFYSKIKVYQGKILCWIKIVYSEETFQILNQSANKILKETNKQNNLLTSEIHRTSLSFPPGGVTRACLRRAVSYTHVIVLPPTAYKISCEQGVRTSWNGFSARHSFFGCSEGKTTLSHQGLTMTFPIK